jgi:hypothetical protein
MKNLFNIGFIVLILVVLGCNCSKLDEFTKGSRGSATPTPLGPLDATPTPSSTTKPTTSSTGLTKEKFGQLKNGMSYKQVAEIIGSEGEEVSMSEVGRYKVASYKWQGPDFQMIICVFNNDKMTSKTQANLK